MNTDMKENAEVETISNLGIEHTWQEVLALAEAYSHHSGLRKEQIAVNSIGFPFIPIPEVRQSGSRIRLAPRNVTADFIGHPILLEKFEAIDADGVFKVFQHIYTEYVEVWKRARLAYINFTLQPEVKEGRGSFFYSYEELAAAYDEENELRYEDVNRYIESDGSSDDVSRLDEFIGDMDGSSHSEPSVEPVERSDNQALDDLLGELDDYSGYTKPQTNKYDIELD